MNLSDIPTALKNRHILQDDDYVVVSRIKLNGIDYVIKELGTTPGEQREYFQSQLRSEHDFLNHLDHENIIKTHGYWENPTSEGLVIENATRGDMFGLLVDGKETKKENRHSLRGVARALHYLHKKHIVHNDVKPANVLLMENYNSVLADFGCTQYDDEEWNENLTVTHAAPELFGKDIAFGTQADVWAFGVMVYEAETKTTPFTSAGILKKRECYVDNLDKSQLSTAALHVLEHTLTDRESRWTIEDVLDCRYFDI